MAVVIDLYGVDLGVIVALPTGVVYSNQADGVACTHPQQEGAYVPLVTHFRDTPPRHDQALVAYFDQRPGNRGHLEPAEADELDDILARIQDPFAMTIDRSRLEDSVEAWIHVVLTLPTAPPHYSRPLVLPYPCSGVLVWENSD